MVLPDLRENDRFIVADYEEDAVRGLPNARELSLKFESGCATLMDHYVSATEIYQGSQRNKTPYLMNRPHGRDYTPETAIRKMFMTIRFFG